MAHIIQRDRPGLPVVTEFDQAVLAALTNPTTPAEVAKTVGSPTHRVAVRLKVLADRGLVLREKVPGGPANGRGSVKYRRAD